MAAKSKPTKEEVLKVIQEILDKKSKREEQQKMRKLLEDPVDNTEKLNDFIRKQKKEEKDLDQFIVDLDPKDWKKLKKKIEREDRMDGEEESPVDLGDEW